MSSEETGQRTIGKLEVMGVASVCSKRRLENGEVSEQDSPASKIARKNIFTETYTHSHQDTIVHETSNSDFLTTSILARTLLTGSSSSNNENFVHVPVASACSPLDSLKSLEAMPVPAAMESLLELSGGARFQPPHHPTKVTIEESTELEFTNLLCHETSLATVTILSPIDEDSGEWRTSVKHKSHSHSILSDQVITEDENGKSYFNLGPSDATILARKSSSNFATSDQSWMNVNGGDIDLMDDTSSSSSCDSISSEDLFNSCEEFDPSDDEEEVRTYKQERSTVLHLSLCKLNMFRTHCLEPSLRRSVLICNTLRHIEQEIRSEDEVKDGNSGGSLNLESRETLPPFWPSSNAPRNPGNLRVEETLPLPDMNNGGHDPYLSSNSYTNESPYTSYDYNSLPSQTPFHAASYDEYSESALGVGGLGVGGSPILTELVSSPPALLECDSGYGEDLELSSYYYGGSPSPNEFSTASVLMDNARYCQQDVPIGAGQESTSNSCLNGGDINSTTNTVTVVKGILSSNCQPPDENISATTGSTSNPEKYLDANDVVAAVNENIHCWSPSSTIELGNIVAATAQLQQQQYAQQEGQCGLESRRSDYGGYGHQQLPMDSLVSTSYSSLS